MRTPGASGDPDDRAGCAHASRAHPGRAWGPSDSCVSREPLSLAWLDNWQPRGIPCGPISSRACTAASDDPARFAGVRVLGVDEHVWHHQDRRRRGPRELTGIVDLTRGEDHPTARLLVAWSQAGLAPCTRTGSKSAAKTSVRGCESRRWIPSRDSKNAIDDQLQDTTSILDAFRIVKLAGDAPGEVRRRVQQDTTGHRGRKGDPLYQIRLLLRASRRRLTPRQKERLREAFVAGEAHISVKVAYLHRASARRLPSRHTRPRPAPGRSSHREPTKVSHPRNHSPRGEPYASGRTHSTPTSIPAEPATGQQKPSTDIIELGKRTARGYRNPTNYQLRMLLIAGGLDASTHTQL